MVGKRMTLRVNAKAFTDQADEKMKVFTSLINAFFGETQQIIYYMR